MSRSEPESDAADGETEGAAGPEAADRDGDGDSADPAHDPTEIDRDPPDPDGATGRFDRIDRTTRWVLAVVAGGLLARLAFLGARVAHYDEGRVAWWSNYFLESGQFEYRYIIHGPLVQHVNKFLFDALGPSDFTMRLFVALVGAFLPLAALLFREHLDGDEVIGVAFFLAFSPLLLYFSRFFRSTLLAAAFAFVAFSLLVRAYDERSVWHVYGAVVFVALAFTAKENAAVYLLVWVGASALLLDQALFRTGGDQSGFEWARERLDARTRPLGDYVADFLWHGAIALVLFLAVTLYFYAPRSPGTEAVGFWQAVTNPTLFPELFDRTLDDVVEGYSYWFGGTTDAGCRKDNVIDAYLCFLGQEVHAMAQSALALTMMAVVGFLAERWGRVRSRAVVLFCAYWGFVSVLGYPLGTDIANAWIMVNALVPLAIPAGVGLAYVTREARDSLGGDPIRFGVVVFILFLIAGQMTFALADGVYLNPASDENDLVQYAQPADDFRPDMRFVENQPDHDGVDVLFVGSPYVRDQPRFGGMDPKCLNIGNALPLHWYVEIYDADVACEQRISTAVANLSEHDPLVVVVADRGSHQIADDLEGYEVETHRLRAWGRETAFFTSKTGFAGNASVG